MACHVMDSAAMEGTQNTPPRGAHGEGAHHGPLWRTASAVASSQPTCCTSADTCSLQSPHQWTTLNREEVLFLTLLGGCVHWMLPKYSADS
mmetsp:Transcript_93422/g.300776  ORF Transcript_93422/g.300776 Transcript_93422/m.300776 type:complete len:91 (-) Transcript_93422:1119-1391(-)